MQLHELEILVLSGEELRMVGLVYIKLSEYIDGIQRNQELKVIPQGTLVCAVRIFMFYFAFVFHVHSTCIFLPNMMQL